MNLRFHEIAETNHSIQSPLKAEQLIELGDICNVSGETRHLDLACGRGELSCQWALKFGTSGIGVDNSENFIASAKARAFELEVSDKINFVVDDVASYPQPFHNFDVVTYIGGSWLGDSFTDTLKLMKSALKERDGYLLIGEPYWLKTPTHDVLKELNLEADTFSSLVGTLDAIESVGLDLVEMRIASRESIDTYSSRQWHTVDQWLHENSNDPLAPALRQWMAHNRRMYLTYEREYMGWGVFVVKEMA